MLVRDLFPKPKKFTCVGLGSYLRIQEQPYIVARTGPNHVGAINLLTGTPWSTSVNVCHGFGKLGRTEVEKILLDAFEVAVLITRGEAIELLAKADDG